MARDVPGSVANSRASAGPDRGHLGRDHPADLADARRRHPRLGRGQPVGPGDPGPGRHRAAARQPDRARLRGAGRRGVRRFRPPRHGARLVLPRRPRLDPPRAHRHRGRRRAGRRGRASTTTSRRSSSCCPRWSSSRAWCSRSSSGSARPPPTCARSERSLAADPVPPTVRRSRRGLDALSVGGSTVRGVRTDVRCDPGGGDLDPHLRPGRPRGRRSVEEAR